jgi:ATP adenylyltransferase
VRAGELQGAGHIWLTVVEALCRPEQTYVSLWSHGAATRKHLHVAVQPVTAAVVARYGGLRSEQLQARMLASGDEPDTAGIQRFCDQARELFQAITRTASRD